MDPITKIATCCYCGTRATLTLAGHTRHELACASCGAPLHEMRQVKRESPAPVAYRKGKVKSVKPAYKLKKQKQKKKRGFGYWLKEAFDELEDIFD